MLCQHELEQEFYHVWYMIQRLHSSLKTRFSMSKKKWKSTRGCYGGTIILCTSSFCQLILTASVLQCYNRVCCHLEVQTSQFAISDATYADWCPSLPSKALIFWSWQNQVAPLFSYYSTPSGLLTAPLPTPTELAVPSSAGQAGPLLPADFPQYEGDL